MKKRPSNPSRLKNRKIHLVALIEKRELNNTGNRGIPFYSLVGSGVVGSVIGGG
jgi:hypothetical protein